MLLVRRIVHQRLVLAQSFEERSRYGTFARKTQEEGHRSRKGRARQIRSSHPIDQTQAQQLWKHQQHCHGRPKRWHRKSRCSTTAGSQTQIRQIDVGTIAPIKLTCVIAVPFATIFQVNRFDIFFTILTPIFFITTISKKKNHFTRFINSNNFLEKLCETNVWNILKFDNKSEIIS